MLLTEWQRAFAYLLEILKSPSVRMGVYVCEWVIPRKWLLWSLDEFACVCVLEWVEWTNKNK